MFIDVKWYFGAGIVEWKDGDQGNITDLFKFNNRGTLLEDEWENAFDTIFKYKKDKGLVEATLDS